MFAKLPVASNKWVNVCASTTFGIYLIHDNLYVRNYLWTDWLRCAMFYLSNKLWLHGVICCVTFFLGCMLIEMARKYLLEIIHTACQGTHSFDGIL